MRLVSSRPGSTAARGTLVIEFFDAWEKLSRRRPPGATRLEVYMMLLPPGAPFPDEPLDVHGLALGHVGSFTRSPMRVSPPSPDAAMQVVCWGRWAGNSGMPGPFSEPLLAGLVGGRRGLLALAEPRNADAAEGRIGQTVVITSARRELPDRVETIETVRAESRRLLSDESADAA
jgi:hypothetical protein